MKLLIIFFLSLSINASILKNSDRLMVFAPHPDDEVLGAGALIREALQMGLEVKVVVMTCGDGYWNALNTLISSGNAIDHDQGGDFDYLDLGVTRCGESSMALGVLGVSDREFMGLPDGGMWNIFSGNELFKSRYTKVTSVPYDFAEKIDYKRSAVVTRLQLLINDFNPTVVITPTITDSHGDHIATRAFVKEIITSQVKHLEYLIHWEGKEKGYPHNNLVWSKPKGHIVYDYQIDLAEIDWSYEEKRELIGLYYSQVAIDGPYLYKFAKENEVFWVSRPHKRDYLE